LSNFESTTTMRGELFRDVNVALATSYRMASLPAVDAGATRRALVTVACLAPTRSRMHADWVKRLIGEPSRVVDFSGLSRLETRAQCALVRQAVHERLSVPQACAIVARFSQTPTLGFQTGSRSCRARRRSAR
jgi:hypothetical protein